MTERELEAPPLKKQEPGHRTSLQILQMLPMGLQQKGDTCLVFST